MFDSINDLPISGEAVAAALIAKFGRDERWLLSDIETLTDVEALALGDLWSGIRQAPIAISTGDLCSALVLASQVVCLDIQLESDPTVQLLIEDGSRVIT
jgi:hypothetical protein